MFTTPDEKRDYERHYRINHFQADSVAVNIHFQFILGKFVVTMWLYDFSVENCVNDVHTSESYYDFWKAFFQFCALSRFADKLTR